MRSFVLALCVALSGLAGAAQAANTPAKVLKAQILAATRMSVPPSSAHNSTAWQFGEAVQHPSLFRSIALVPQRNGVGGTRAYLLKAPNTDYKMLKVGTAYIVEKGAFADYLSKAVLQGN